MTKPNSLILSSLAGDPDMDELIALFVDDMPARVEKMRSSHAQSDWKILANEAHKLRGSAGGHGFESIGDEAGKLEDLLRHSAAQDEQTLASVSAQVEQLIGLCLRAAVKG